MVQSEAYNFAQLIAAASSENHDFVLQEARLFTLGIQKGKAHVSFVPFGHAKSPGPNHWFGTYQIQHRWLISVNHCHLKLTTVCIARLHTKPEVCNQLIHKIQKSG